MKANNQNDNKKLNKFLSILCIGVLLVVISTNSITVKAAQKEENLKQTILQITKLLESAIEKSLKDADQKVKKTIISEDLDYYMTMESFHRANNPYKDINYLELIAAYSVCKENSNTLQVSDFYSLPFIQVEVEIKNSEEYIPVLVQTYKEMSKGIYEKDVETYINQPSIVNKYKSIGNGEYVTNGQKKIIPETKQKKYGYVTLTGLTVDDILEIYGFENNQDIKKEVKNKGVQFEHLF